MLIAWIPVLFVLIGLLLYLASANPKLQRLGEVIFFCAFLAMMFSLTGKTVRLL